MEIVTFEQILEDSKNRDEEPNYPIYLPKIFNEYADSQTKEIVRILRNDISTIKAPFLVTPEIFKDGLEKQDYSHLEKQINDYSGYCESSERVELEENIRNFRDKKEEIITYLTQLYTNYFSVTHN